MTDIRLASVTCRDHDEALRIGTALLDAKLVVCVNILDGMTSLYEWKGKRLKETESLLHAKTVEAHQETILTLVKKLHSYECPGIVFTKIESGNEEYLSWVRTQTRTEI